MQSSIAIGTTPSVQYLLRIGDSCLILAQRLGEWCGHAPTLEEDIALTNMALDLVGQARAVLTRAAQLDGGGHDEDKLAFLRDERDFRNLTITELPRGDFAFTVIRNLLVACLLEQLWERLRASSDVELAGIAAKAVKEARYHRQYAAEWAERLGDGTEESARRLRAALQALWPYTAEFFADDDTDRAAAHSGFGPAWSDLSAGWLTEVRAVLDRALLTEPGAARFSSTGKQGRHSEHLGHLLAEMQYLQRSFPGGVW